VPQNTKVPGLAIAFATMSLAACSTTAPNPNLPRGEAAYQVIPPEAPQRDQYVFSAGDVISVDVFGETGLSRPQLLVDEAGNVQLPLVGEIKAEGQTSRQLSTQIADFLGRKYLVNPQVSVAIIEPAKRFVTVEGEVKTPGVYEFTGRFSLLSAVARAQSPSDAARLSEVIVFRQVDGKTMVARFDLKKIRSGLLPDPEIINGDVVTIGRSPIRASWQDILKAAPLLNTFVVLNNNN
jgi:polysaccharide export outer membrane protein